MVDIEPKDIVPYELHLFLRITDVIFTTLFLELMKLDHASKIHKDGRTDCLQIAVRNIRCLGISFNVWMSEGSKTRSGLEMTTINRNDRLKVLKSMPAIFDDLLPSTTAVPLAKLWMVSVHILNIGCECSACLL